MTDVIDTHDVDAPSLGVIQEAIRKLTKDERVAGIVLGKDEARFLVDAYYQLQDNRIRNDAQVRSMAKDGEPHAVIQWLADMNRTLEDQIKAALDVYSANDPVGKWLRAQVGIGPVIAAGLLAHLDITKAEGSTQAAQEALARAKAAAPTGLGKVGVFAGKVAGKTIGALSGAAVPLAANEASERWNSGDKSGAILSGVEALAGVLAMLPPATPITAALKGIGITGGLAVAVVDAYMHSDYAKKRAQAPKATPAPQATSGGLNRVSSNNKPPVSGITKDAYGRYHG